MRGHPVQRPFLWEERGLCLQACVRPQASGLASRRCLRSVHVETVCSGAGASAWNWGESDAGQGPEEPCPDWMIIQGIFQGLQ